MTEKKVSSINAAAILSLALISMGVTVVTPAMATLAQHFAGHDVSWISTLPTLFVVAGTFVAGSTMGKNVKYRTLAIVSCILYLIGGCGPAFFDSYSLTLVCRAILGFGLGLLSPLGNALTIGLYKGQKQASMLGYGTLCMNAGGIILQMLGGALAEKGWNITFYGHAFCLIGLFMAFFLPEPEKQEVSPEAPVQTKEKMSKMIWLIAFLFMIFNILNFPIMMNISVLFEMRNAGGAAAAATSLSLYTVAGCIAGLTFGKIFQFAQRWCLTLGYALCGIGALCVYVGTTNIIMTIGLMLLGFGFSIIMPACMSWAGFVTPLSTIAIATSILLALMNLGGFLSSFWLKFLAMAAGENIFSAILVEIFVFLATAVFFVFYNPFKQKK
ncbi:MAG: MFS transporter [Lachnospiraceae bacterium]|nr:MFS transporter [Lachnospiraceae bacterium]